MPFVSSANIACGFHAGDPGVMRTTVRLARRYGVAIGAHPGFQDLSGFGRREMHMRPGRGREPRRLPSGCAGGHRRRRGGQAQPREAARRALQHGRPRCGHGRRHRPRRPGPWTRRWCCSGCRARELIAAGERAGLRVASEVFADRGYRPDGSLAPRGTTGAVMTDPADVARRAVEMASGTQRDRPRRQRAFPSRPTPSAFTATPPAPRCSPAPCARRSPPRASRSAHPEIEGACRRSVVPCFFS